MGMLRFTHAIVCRIPHNVQLDSAIVQTGIDLGRARREQEEFCEALRLAGVDVIELAPEDSAPATSLFVDDVAIVCNGTALITRPNRPTRRKEIAALLMEFGLEIIEADIDNSDIMLQGSDVLFTGREFFVGLTKRTNEAGAKLVAATFPEFSVTPIKVDGAGYLKSHVALASPSILTVGASTFSSNILKRIEREATFRYQTLTMPEEGAANCLSLNNTLMYRSDFPHSATKYQEIQGPQICPINMVELAKLGGLMSQHCILFRRMKLKKT